MRGGSLSGLDFPRVERVGKQIRIPDKSGAQPVRINVNATPSDYKWPEAEYRAMKVACVIENLLVQYGDQQFEVGGGDD